MYPKMALRFNFKPPKMVSFDGPSDGLQGRKTSLTLRAGPLTDLILNSQKWCHFDGPSDGLQGRKTSSLFKRSPFDLESRSKCGVPKNGLTV